MPKTPHFSDQKYSQKPRKMTKSGGKTLQLVAKFVRIRLRVSRSEKLRPVGSKIYWRKFQETLRFQSDRTNQMKTTGVLVIKTVMETKL
jgi:hypothetical protein